MERLPEKNEKWLWALAYAGCPWYAVVYIVITMRPNVISQNTQDFLKNKVNSIDNMGAGNELWPIIIFFSKFLSFLSKVGAGYKQSPAFKKLHYKKLRPDYAK